MNGHKGEPLTLQLPAPVADGDYTVRVALWTETPATMSAAGGAARSLRPPLPADRHAALTWRGGSAA